MTISRRSPRRRPDRVAALAVALAAASIVALAALIAASPGTAQATRSPKPESLGTVKLKLGKQTAKRMRKRGLRLRGARGAKVRGRSLVLPIQSGEVTKLATLQLSGVIKVVRKPRKKLGSAKRPKAKRPKAKRPKANRKRVRAKRRQAKLSKLSVSLMAGVGHVGATIKGTRVTLLTLKGVGEQPFNPLSGRVRIRGVDAILDAAAAAAISKALRGRKLPRRMGRVAVGGSVPVIQQEATNAVVRPRPATAVDLVDASMSWRPRESFIDYIHSAKGGDGGAFAITPALPGPEELIPPSTAMRVYEFDLPFRGGWHDPASNTANVELAGGIQFKKPDFGIDLDAVDPTVELGGEAPRMIAALRGRADTADQDGRTAVTVGLDQSSIPPQVEAVAEGTRYTYTDLPAFVPAGPTAWVLAAYYFEGDPWGEVSVSYTVPDG